GGRAPGESAGIEADEDIGGDTAAAIDGAVFGAEGAVGGAGVAACRIAMEDLAVMEALHYFFIIIFVSFIIGFLDAAAGGRVVARDGEAEGGAVAELEGLLYEAFAEGAAADDGGPIPILEGAG